MKVSELTIAELNYWVARAEGRDVAQWGMVPRDAWYAGDWALGGPIIDREHIDTDWMLALGQWHASMPSKNPSASFGRASGRGETLLIAAMRAYVASKYGDSVPIAS